MLQRIENRIKSTLENIKYRIQKAQNDSGPKTYFPEEKIAVCLICKDENPYLQEWLEYHRSIGFTHFFIYDNNSKIPISETLKYEKDCSVILWKDDEVGKQSNAYFDCCKKNRDYKWILFIDTDEFLILKKHKTIQEFLGDYDAFYAVGLNWICFTGSGHESRAEWFKYDKYIPLDDEVNTHIKSFVRPKSVKLPPKDPHKFSVVTVNEHKNLIKGPLYKHSSDIAYIRHNITRSRNEYIEKINRGRGDGSPTTHSLEIFEAFEKQSI
jgi:hypothetical protein